MVEEETPEEWAKRVWAGMTLAEQRLVRLALDPSCLADADESRPARHPRRDSSNRDEFQAVPYTFERPFGEKART